tara:strand:+ start:1554 stop:1682 length:129 start_codon:yes stop_codon:yes gene_type:complete
MKLLLAPGEPLVEKRFSSTHTKKQGVACEKENFRHVASLDFL